MGGGPVGALPIQRPNRVIAREPQTPGELGEGPHSGRDETVCRTSGWPYKGTKVTDPELGPLPTATRFANGIIIDRRRNNDHTQLRSLSFSEYARAASLPASQVEWMRSMDPDTGFDGGPNSFAALAGAIPRSTLHTMLRICCYETHKAKTTTSPHSISGLSVSDGSFSLEYTHMAPHQAVRSQTCSTCLNLIMQLIALTTNLIRSLLHRSYHNAMVNVSLRLLYDWHVETMPFRRCSSRASGKD